MKLLSITLAIIAALVGLKAAYLWHKASKVVVVPMWANGYRIEPVDMGLAQQEWLVALLETGRVSGEINRRAAAWTAVSVILSAASAVIGLLA